MGLPIHVAAPRAAAGGKVEAGALVRTAIPYAVVGVP